MQGQLQRVQSDSIEKIRGQSSQITCPNPGKFSLRELISKLEKRAERRLRGETSPVPCVLASFPRQVNISEKLHRGVDEGDEETTKSLAAERGENRGAQLHASPIRLRNDQPEKLQALRSCAEAPDFEAESGERADQKFQAALRHE